MKRLPSLEVIEKYAFRFVSAGVPLLAIALSLAIVSIAIEGQWIYLADLKVIISLTALVLYVSNFIRRRTHSQVGYMAARYNLLAFGIMILNVLVNPISSFH